MEDRANFSFAKKFQFLKSGKKKLGNSYVICLMQSIQQESTVNSQFGKKIGETGQNKKIIEMLDVLRYQET